jgi:hypothetical protein
MKDKLAIFVKDFGHYALVVWDLKLDDIHLMAATNKLAPLLLLVENDWEITFEKTDVLFEREMRKALTEDRFLRFKDGKIGYMYKEYYGMRLDYTRFADSAIDLAITGVNVLLKDLKYRIRAKHKNEKIEHEHI